MSGKQSGVLFEEKFFTLQKEISLPGRSIWKASAAWLRGACWRNLMFQLIQGLPLITSHLEMESISASSSLMFSKSKSRVASSRPEFKNKNNNRLDCFHGLSSIQRTNVLQRLLPVHGFRLREVLGELVARHDDPLVVRRPILLEDVLPVGDPRGNPVVFAEAESLQTV